jgi:hypothetical protein
MRGRRNNQRAGWEGAGGERVAKLALKVNKVNKKEDLKFY